MHKITNSTPKVLDYFQFEFVGICRPVLEYLIKSGCTNMQDQPNNIKNQQIWGWNVISMNFESFRLLQSTLYKC